MISPAKARTFVEELSVGTPVRTRAVRATRGAEKPAVDFRSDNQALVVGSPIAEFAKNVPADIRPNISNSLLLAQLAANKATKNASAPGASAAWRESYRNVLLNTGWAFEGSSVGMQEIRKTDLEVHKAIIPVLAAVLGPAVAAGALVTAVLRGLESMNEKTPWITLFDRESRRASLNQFQIGYVQAPKGAAPRMSIIFFELNVTGSVTQVLFFKFSSTKGSLLHSHTDLSVNASTFAAVRDAVQQKVADHARRAILTIDI
jgi:hypothetical protein